MTSFRNANLLLCELVLLVFAVPSGKAAVEANSLTWAIVSSQEFAKTGIPDLLFVELANTKDIELIERERYRSVVNEAEMSALGNSASLDNRIDLGNQVSADVLVLLDLVKTQQLDLQKAHQPASNSGQADLPLRASQSIRLIVCDARSGARVSLKSIEMQGSSPEDVTRRLCDLILSSREKLTDGLRYVVGVSPFLSKNLTHDCDSYQEIIAHLAESLFLSMPGVAVLEHEEANHIWNELAARQDSSLHRVVPILIEGDFAAKKAPGSNDLQFTVHMTCRISGGSTQEAVEANITASNLPANIAETLQKLLSQTPEWTGSQIRKADQFQWLKERAGMFSHLGMWKSAIGLRQAALLFDPKNVELRLSQIYDQRRLLWEMGSTNYDQYAEWNGPIGSVSRAERLIRVFFDQLQNEEYLIQNRLIDTTQAVRIFSFSSYSSPQTGIREEETSNEKIQQLVSEAQQQQREYLNAIAADLFQLPNTSERKTNDYPLGRLASLQTVLLSRYLGHIDYQPWTLDDLHDLRRIWTTAVPDEIGFPGVLAKITYSLNPKVPEIETKLPYHLHDYEEKKITVEQWLAFLEDLSLVSHRTARLSARVELLKWRWYLLDRKSPPQETIYLKDMVDSLAMELEDYPVQDNRGVTYLIGGGGFPLPLVDRIRWQLYRFSVMPDYFAPRRKLKFLPALPSPRRAATPAQRAAKQETGSKGRVRGELLDLKLSTGGFESRLPRNASPELRTSSRYANGRSKSPERLRWLACGEQLDIAWTPLVVHIMKTAGKLEELTFPVNKDVVIDDVRWDGQLLWITTLTSGVFVYDRQIQLVCHITGGHGLPPSEHALKIQPLGKGQACAVGSFGPQFRAWCAMVRIQDGKPRLKVFHEAKEVSSISGAIADAGQDDTQQAFVPFLLLRHSDVQYPNQGDRDLLYIGRLKSGTSQMTPLLVNLADLSVFTDPLVSTFDFHGSVNGIQEDQFLSYQGQLYHVSTGSNLVRQQFQRGIGLLAPFLPNREQGFIRIGDIVYLPALNNWLQLDLKSGLVSELLYDQLSKVGLSNDFVFTRSAHYGIIGWDWRGSFCKIEIMPHEIQKVTGTDFRDADRPKNNPPLPSVGPKEVTPVLESNVIPKDVELSGIRVRIRELVKENRISSPDPQVLYTSGIATFDGWLPHVNFRDVYLDPPKKKEGFKLILHNGRVQEVLSLKEGFARTKVWFNERGAPVLSAHFSRDRRSGMTTPSSYFWGVYDQRGLLEKVIQLDRELDIRNVTVFEHGDDYQYLITRTYSKTGGARGRVQKELALDSQGDLILPGDHRAVAYSPRYEKVTEPTRIGIKPYYPIPGLPE